MTWSDGDAVTQLAKRFSNKVRLASRIAGVACSAVLLAGCGFSSITSGLGSSIFGGASDKPTTVHVGSVTEEQLLSAAKADGSAVGGALVSQNCPRFSVWPRDNTLTVYEVGRTGDGLAIEHRGEITKTARECRVEPGKVTIRYGFSGRVLLGPRGQPGVVKLPVNIFLTDPKREKIRTEKMQVVVSVSLDNPIGYFSSVHTVTFTIKEGTRPVDYELFVGFERNVKGAG